MQNTQHKYEFKPIKNHKTKILSIKNSNKLTNEIEHARIPSNLNSNLIITKR